MLDELKSKARRDEKASGRASGDTKECTASQRILPEMP